MKKLIYLIITLFVLCSINISAREIYDNETYGTGTYGQAEPVVAPTPPPSGGGPRWEYVDDSCKINITPSNITFNLTTLDVAINITNNAVFDTYINLHPPLVPTLFGLKDYLLLSDEISHITMGRTKEFNISLIDTGGIEEEINISMLIEAINCEIQYPIIIKKRPGIFYDLKITTDGYYYYKDDIVNVTVFIENKGDIPDTDTNLILYIISPEGKKDILSEEKLKEVDIGVTIIYKDVMLTPDMLSGKYTIGIEYATEQQGLLRTSSSIYILPTKREIANIVIFFMIGFIIIVVLFFFLLVYKLKDEKENTSSVQ